MNINAPQTNQQLSLGANSTRTQFTVRQFLSLVTPLPKYLSWASLHKVPPGLNPPKSLDDWKKIVLRIIINPERAILTDDEAEELLEIKLKEWLNEYKNLKTQEKIRKQKQSEELATLAGTIGPIISKRTATEIVEDAPQNKRRRTGNRLEQLLANVKDFKVTKSLTPYKIPNGGETTMTSVDRGKVSLLDELNNIMSESVEEVNKIFTDVYNTKGQHIKADKVSSLYSNELSKFGSMKSLMEAPKLEEDLDITPLQNMYIKEIIKPTWITLYKYRLHLRKKFEAFAARLIEKESKFNATGGETKLFSITVRIEQLETSIRNEGNEEAWTYGTLFLNIMKWFNDLIITITTSKLTWNHEYHDLIMKLYHEIYQWMNSHKQMKPYAVIWRKYVSSYLGTKIPLLPRLTSKSSFSETAQQFCFMHISNYNFWALASKFNDATTTISTDKIKKIQALLSDLGLRNEGVYMFPNPWEWNNSLTSKRTSKTWKILFEERKKYKLSEMSQDMWVLYSFKDEVVNGNINLDIFKKVEVQLPHDINIDDYDLFMNNLHSDEENELDLPATISPTRATSNIPQNAEHNIMYQQEEQEFAPHNEENPFLLDEELEQSPTLNIPPSSNPQSPQGGELENGMFFFWEFQKRSEKQYKVKMGRVLGQNPSETVYIRELPANGEHSVDYFCNIHYH